MSNSILRLPAVLARTGLSRSTLYMHIEKGLWPKQVRIGDRAVGWPDREVTAMNQARISGKPEDAIRELVKRLVAARKEAR